MSNEPTLAQLQDLLTWTDGWNSYDALAPNPEAVARATTWITEVYERLQQQWIVPNVTATGDGDAFFSWQYKQRDLEVIIGTQEMSYLQAWDKGPHAKLTDGDIETIDDMLQLWKWLLDTSQEQEA